MIRADGPMFSHSQSLIKVKSRDSRFTPQVNVNVDILVAIGVLVKSQIDAVLKGIVQVF